MGGGSGSGDGGSGTSGCHFGGTARNPHGDIFVFSLASRGRVLAAAVSDGTCRLLDSQSCKEVLPPLADHAPRGAAVFGVALSPSLPLLATAAADGKVFMHDLRKLSAGPLLEVRGHTQASLQQAVGHVMSKAVKSCALDEWEAERSEAERAAAAEIRYGRVPRGVPGTRGIMAETEAAAHVLRTRTETFLTLMRGDGDAFATRWFPSRSAKSHARRRRPGGVGVG